MAPNSAIKIPESVPRCFVRVRNVSEHATPSDIDNFFAGLIIPDGGICISGKNAFVSFSSPEDMGAALNMPLRTLFGQAAYVSGCSEYEMERLKMEHLHRNVSPTPVHERLAWIDEAIQHDRAIRRRYFHQLRGNRIRKLRPVKVSKDRPCTDNTKFIVRETQYPTNLDTHFQTANSHEDRQWKPTRYGMKRIRPTPAPFLGERLPAPAEIGRDI